MKSGHLLTCFLVAVLALASCSKRPAQETDTGQKLPATVGVAELPRPNSGTFSFAEAEARKSEILSNVPTVMLEEWKNPYMGFCIHIHKDDSISVYRRFFPARLNKNKDFSKESVAEVKRLADELPLEGNPAGILVTSDLPLKESKAIRDVLNAIFVPSVQLFYVCTPPE